MYSCLVLLPDPFNFFSYVSVTEHTISPPDIHVSAIFLFRLSTAEKIQLIII